MGLTISFPWWFGGIRRVSALTHIGDVLNKSNTKGAGLARLLCHADKVEQLKDPSGSLPDAYSPSTNVYFRLNSMRERPSARLLITTPKRRVLLFRFVHKTGVLAGKDYWATPGGGVEHGEAFADAAIRELREETGICEAQVSEPVGRREVPLQLPHGEHVLAVEQYFVVNTDTESISRDGWTAEEMEVMADHQWWNGGAGRNCPAPPRPSIRKD